YPTGNIPLNEANQITKSPYVKQAIPLSLGDSYSTFRIVGTEHSYVELYKATLKEGRLWEADYEVTLGAFAADKLGFKVGDTFFGQHGMAQGGHFHEEDTYQVVGVLDVSNTVMDNLVLTSLESVWGMHEYKEEKGQEEEEEGSHEHEEEMHEEHDETEHEDHNAEE